MKKVLITGGAGFIGSNLIKVLQGSEITVIDNLHSQIHGDPLCSESYLSIKEKCNLIRGDVSDELAWKDLKGQNFDCIYLLAAETGTGQSMMESQRHVRTNVLSVSLLNDMINREEISADKIVLASSRAVYGTSAVGSDGSLIPSKETDEARPTSIYGATKLAQENICMAGFQKSSVTVLRLQNVYGPGQSLINPYTGILSIFFSAIRAEKSISVFSDGLMTRDFVYIDDAVSALVRAGSDPSDREIYNVGSGRSTTVLKVAQTLISLCSSSSEIIVSGEELRGDIRHNLADLTKSRKWGYEPQTFFDEGCRKFFAWALESETAASSYHDSLSLLRKTGILKKV